MSISFAYMIAQGQVINKDANEEIVLNQISRIYENVFKIGCPVTVKSTPFLRLNFLHTASISACDLIPEITFLF